MVRLIPLGNGAEAKVDDEDFDWLTRRGRWHLDGYGKNYYAVRNFLKCDGKYGKERMHRLLLPQASIVDHINGDCLDNRRSNLRQADDTTSARNRSKRSDSKQPYKGIQQRARSWGAEIYVSGRRIHLGSFASAELAARAYDSAALEHFGEFARINFPAVKD